MKIQIIEGNGVNHFLSLDKFEVNETDEHITICRVDDQTGEEYFMFEGKKDEIREIIIKGD